MVVIICAKMV